MGSHGLAMQDARPPALAGGALEVTGAGRDILAALYPFTGGANFSTLAQAHALADLSRAELAEALGGLVGASLVTVRTAGGVARYEIPGTTRATLGRQRWLADRLAELSRAHAAWCEGFLAGAEEALAGGPDQKSWLERIALEQANLSAGLSFALRSNDLALAGRLALGMSTFWEMRGPLAHARSLVLCLLRAGPLAPGVRARLLDALGRLLLRQGQCEAASRALHQARSVAGAEPARLALARGAAHLGLAELCCGRPGSASGALDQAVVELCELGSPADLARAYAAKALVSLARGRTAESLAGLERAISLQLGAGDVAGWATSRLYRSLWHLKSKAPDDALQDAREAAQIFSDLGDQGATATSLLAAAVALSDARPAAAVELAELSQSLRRDVGALALPGLYQVAMPLLDRAKRAGQRRQPRAQGAALSPLEALARAAGPTEAGPDDGRPSAYVQALGGFQVLRDGKALLLPPQVARLVKLVIVGGGQVHVEQAAESLWPEVAPALGKRRLRNVLSKLRSAAGSLVARDTSTLRLGPRVEVDALRFEAAAREALGALSVGGGEGGIAKALEAHRLYSGDLLPEDRYEDFAIVARERLSWLHLRLLDAAASAAAEAHQDRTVEHCLRAALEIDPTDEDRYVALARHLMSRGRHAAASQVLAKAREVLTRLGLPASSALLRATVSPRHEPRARERSH